MEKSERERERHVSARLRGEETEGNSVTTAPNALKSLTLLPLCVIWLTICLVIFALSFWLVVVYLRRTVPERRLVVREKKVVSLGPESPSQKERHHPRGGPGTPSPSLPLSLSLHERSGPGHLAPGQDGVSSHSPPRQADLALPVHQQDELNHLRSSSVSPQLPPPTSTTTRTLNHRSCWQHFSRKVWEQKSVRALKREIGFQDRGRGEEEAIVGFARHPGPGAGLTESSHGHGGPPVSLSDALPPRRRGAWRGAGHT